MTSTATRPTSTHPWLGLASLALGLAMIVLDGTIVGVSLPVIIDDLGLSLTDAQWVNSLYSVVFAALLLVMGRLGDRFGRRRLFVIGTVVFVAGSVTAALAGGAGALIASRALQGVGGAMILPASLSTVNATFRGADRARAFGVWGAVMAGAAALGPLLGGWLTSSYSWRWVFYVNIPVGVAVLVGTWLFVRETKAAQVARGNDLVGTVLSALGFGLLVFGLIEGTTLGWWTPKAALDVGPLHWPAEAAISVVPVCLAVGVVVLLAMVWWEARFAGPAAILDTSLFRIGSFTWGNVAAGAVAAGEFALVFVLPLYLVNARGLGVMGAGWILAAMALGALASGAAARHLAALLGPARVVILGLSLEVAAAAALALLVHGGVATGWLVLPLVAYGLGLGLASAQLTSVVLSQVPADRSGTGSATQSTVRQLGSALGSALAGTVLAVQLQRLLPGALAGSGVPGQAVDGLSDATVSSAGGTIAQLAAQGSSSQFGDHTGAVVAALTDGFGQAASAVVWMAVVALVLGLLGSLQVARANRLPR